MSRLHTRFLAALVVAAATLAGCGERSASSDGRPIEQTASRDGVTLTLTVDRPRVAVAEPLTLTLRAVTPERLAVRWPETTAQLGGFEVRGQAALPSIPTDNGRQYEIRYTLDSLTSGTVEIPALTVAVVGKPPAGDAPRADEPPAFTLSTEPVKVSVASVLDAKADPRQFRDIKGAATLAPPDDPWRRTLLIGGVAGGLVALAVGAWLLRRWLRARVLTPQQWALRELDTLRDERLAEQRDYEAFYLRLSGVVRLYIERQFGLHAPERTTQEFLADLQATPVLSVDHKALLAEFLEAADMVKFARYSPEQAESARAIETARQFIEQSARREPVRTPAEVAA